jgi:phosphoglycerol transferase MdoB-like AlkP superfamily enzyme
MSSMFDRSLLDYLSASSVAAVTGTLGLLLTAVALVLLGERELLGPSPTRRHRLLVLDAVVAPLLVAFVAVVVVRFNRMSF